jgi:hypothetical protein
VKKKRSLQIYKPGMPVSTSRSVQEQHIRKYDNHITLVNKGVSNVKIRPRIVAVVVPGKSLVKSPRSLIKLRPRGLVIHERERLPLVSVPKVVPVKPLVRKVKKDPGIDFFDKASFLRFFHSYDESHESVSSWPNQNEDIYDDCVWDEWEGGGYDKSMSGFKEFYDDHGEWEGMILDGWGGGDLAGFYFFNHDAPIKELFARDVWDQAEVGEQDFITEYNMFHDPFDGMFMKPGYGQTFSGYDEKRYAIVATFGYPVFISEFSDPQYRRVNAEEYDLFKKMRDSGIPFAWYVGGEVDREGAIFVPKEYEQQAKDLLKEGPSWHSVSSGKPRKRK